MDSLAGDKIISFGSVPGCCRGADFTHCHAYQFTNLEPTTTMIAELRLPALKTHITTVAGCSHADLATLPAGKNALEATNAYACGMQQLLALS